MEQRRMMFATGIGLVAGSLALRPILAAYSNSMSIILGLTIGLGAFMAAFAAFKPK